MRGVWSVDGRLLFGAIHADLPAAPHASGRRYVAPGRYFAPAYPPTVNTSFHVVRCAGDPLPYWAPPHEVPRRWGPVDRVTFIRYQLDAPPKKVGQFTYVAVPHWLLAGLTALPAAWWAARVLSRAKTVDRLRKGLCPNCAYDLRATPDVCPECGTVRADAALRVSDHVALEVALARAAAAVPRVSLFACAGLAALWAYAAAVGVLSLAPRPVADQLFYLDAYVPLPPPRVPLWVAIVLTASPLVVRLWRRLYRGRAARRAQARAA
jgi:hypothetical protein